MYLSTNTPHFNKQNYVKELKITNNLNNLYVFPHSFH